RTAIPCRPDHSTAARHSYADRRVATRRALAHRLAAHRRRAQETAPARRFPLGSERAQHSARRATTRLRYRLGSRRTPSPGPLAAAQPRALVAVAAQGSWPWAATLR